MILLSKKACCRLWQTLQTKNNRKKSFSRSQQSRNWYKVECGEKSVRVENARKKLKLAVFLSCCSVCLNFNCIFSIRIEPCLSQFRVNFFSILLFYFILFCCVFFCSLKIYVFGFILRKKKKIFFKWKRKTRKKSFFCINRIATSQKSVWNSFFFAFFSSHVKFMKCQKKYCFQKVFLFYLRRRSTEDDFFLNFSSSVEDRIFFW